MGIVQTAYANGASTAFIRNKLGIEVSLTPTGVKYLHEEAVKFDIGIYFEANGHGTVLFSDALLQRLHEVCLHWCHTCHSKSTVAVRSVLAVQPWPFTNSYH